MDDDNAILMFEEDYHDSMNAEAYENWFEKRLCPNLEPNSVIVIDNASYHSRNCPDYPLSTWKKNELSNWLKDKGSSIEHGGTSAFFTTFRTYSNVDPLECIFMAPLAIFILWRYPQ